MDFLDLAKKIALKLESIGGKKIEVLDVSKKTNQGKFFIICTLSNEEIVKTSAGMLIEYMKGFDSEILHEDGIFKGEWVVLNFEEIFVHLLTEPMRQKYNLERTWKDSKNSIPFKETTNK